MVYLCVLTLPWCIQRLKKMKVRNKGKTQVSTTTTLNSTTHSHATTSHPNQKLLTLLQLNINSITNKHEELKLLVTELQPDIITIQETKLKKHNKTPQIPTYSAIRTDRANGKGGGLLTYIKHNITFSDTKIPNFINPINTELQIIQLHITHKKMYTFANIYIPPRNTTSPDHAIIIMTSSSSSSSS